MIAFDIDGVLVSDISFDEDIEKYLERRYCMFPLFIPKGSYYLITGRPSIDKELTQKWIDENLTNKPIKLFHDNPYFDKYAEYKVKVIKENPDITIYIESSEEEAEFIRKNTSIRVITFNKFILEGIENEGIF